MNLRYCREWRKILFTALALLGASMASAGAVEIVAHRGASYDAPENTVGSLKLAFAQGADAGEMDIRLTRDSKIMVMHDANTFRTSGFRHAMTDADSTDLRKLEVGQWGKFKGGKYSEKIPFLTEVLAIVPDDKKIFVEIKCGAEILPQLEKDLQSAGLKTNQIVLICFNYEVLKAAKARMPQYMALWLVSQDRKTKQFTPVEELIEKARSAGFDGLNLNFRFPIDKQFVSKVHDASLRLYTWTVDNPQVARAQAAAGVDGIATNRPEWIRQQLALP